MKLTSGLQDFLKNDIPQEELELSLILMKASHFCNEDGGHAAVRPAAGQIRVTCTH